MKISKLYPSKYVKAADLNGKTITLVMANLKVEELGHGKDAERKPVLYFQKATKGLILNATNARTIAALYGDESDDWTGKSIAIYPDKVRAFGKMHDVIRVREEIPAQPKPSQQTAVVEENEIDDAEDVTDIDEGDEQRQIDPETGEILDDGDSLFAPEPPSLQRLIDTGKEVLGDDWEMAQPWLVRQWTGKVTPKSKRDNIGALTTAEQDLLADYLMEATKGIQSAWLKQKAAMLQSTGIAK